MKRILYIIALIATTLANAQTISPTPSNELCPNQEYTFTVPDLPGAYNGINTSGGAQITQFPTGSGTSITFKGKFSDGGSSAGQIFTVYWDGGSKEFKFTRVKSFFGGYKEGGNAPTLLTIPICQTTPIALNITGDQYWDASTNPYTSFGSINDYRFIIPSGWYLNSTLSNGSTWITANGSVTITPTANTGNGSVIQYVAKSSCSGAFYEGTPRYISISRPNPTFTLSPTSLIFVCGTPQTKTFTVSTPTTISCSLSYAWNLGGNNGWLYNGSPAPASFSTSTNSITLTSSGNVLPSSVSVTPILNGVSQPTKTCSTTISPFTSSGSISGYTTICTTRTYTFNGLLAGQTVAWSLSNATAGTLSTTTGTSTILTKTGGGAVYLTATVSNACGQSVDKYLALFAGSPQAYSLVRASNETCDGIKYHYVPFEIPNRNPLINYTFNIAPIPGVTVAVTTSTYNGVIQNVLRFPKTYVGPVDFTVVSTNSCGTISFYAEEEINSCDNLGLRVSNPIKYFTVFPNPATDIINIELLNKKDQSIDATKISADLFDMMVIKKASIPIIDFSGKINVTDLQKGIYILKINLLCGLNS